MGVSKLTTTTLVSDWIEHRWRFQLLWGTSQFGNSENRNKRVALALHFHGVSCRVRVCSTTLDPVTWDEYCGGGDVLYLGTRSHFLEMASPSDNLVFVCDLLVNEAPATSIHSLTTVVGMSARRCPFKKHLLECNSIIVLSLCAATAISSSCWVTASSMPTGRFWPLDRLCWRFLLSLALPCNLFGLFRIRSCAISLSLSLSLSSSNLTRGYESRCLCE